MQTWTDEKLIGNLIKGYIKMPNRVADDESIHKKRLDNLNAIHREIIRRMSLTEDERRKAYKNGYDQGKFDEAADHVSETETYERARLSPMKHIGTFTAEAEYKGKLPRRERIE